MELRQLRYFVAVAESLSFTRAAEKLHIAQPALSRQVRQLEEEIGTELLIRGRRSISLTAAGRVLLEEARILLARSTRAVEAARRAQKAAPPLVRVGIAVGLGERVNAALLRHARDFPEVEVQCRNVVSGHQNEALLRFKIDVGFLRPPVDTIHLYSETLFREPFVALVPRASPLAKHKKLMLRQLASAPLLLQRRSVSSGLYDKILKLYDAAHIVPHIIHTTAAPYEESGAMLVASGKGIYIGVGAALEHPVFSKGVKTIPIDEPDASIDVQMAWRKDEQSSAVARFLQSVRKTFHPQRNNSST